MSWRHKTKATTVLWNFLVAFLVAVIFVASVSTNCDFDDDDCIDIAIVSSEHTVLETVTSNALPPRARVGKDRSGADLADTPWTVTVAVAGFGTEHPGGPAGIAWFPPWTAASLTSRAGDTPELPPNI